MSQKEFVAKGFWKDNAIGRFLSERRYPNVDWAYTKVNSTRPCSVADTGFARGCDLIASCTYKKYQFNLPIYIPQEIKTHTVKIDTINGYYRRLVLPLKQTKGIIGIYMRPAKYDPTPGFLQNGIVIGTRDLNKDQQKLAIEIFSTLRPKQKEKPVK